MKNYDTLVDVDDVRKRSYSLKAENDHRILKEVRAFLKELNSGTGKQMEQPGPNGMERRDRAESGPTLRYQDGILPTRRRRLRQTDMDQPLHPKKHHPTSGAVSRGGEVGAGTIPKSSSRHYSVTPSAHQMAPSTNF